MSPYKPLFNHEVAPSYGFRIWIAGDYNEARRTCRKMCDESGACFSLSKVDYIYSGGEERGVCVTVMNYPRFPNTVDELRSKAINLAHQLLLDLSQGSYTIEPYGIENEKSQWYSRRKSD